MDKKTNVFNKKINLVGSASGWLMIIIGIIVWFDGVTTNVQSAIQQTVEWLEYVVAFMLICSGIICNYLGKILFAIRENGKKLNSESDFNLDVK